MVADQIHQNHDNITEMLKLKNKARPIDLKTKIKLESLNIEQKVKEKLVKMER